MSKTSLLTFRNRFAAVKSRRLRCSKDFDGRDNMRKTPLAVQEKYVLFVADLQEADEILRKIESQLGHYGFDRFSDQALADETAAFQLMAERTGANVIGNANRMAVSHEVIVPSFFVGFTTGLDNVDVILNRAEFARIEVMAALDAIPSDRAGEALALEDLVIMAFSARRILPSAEE